MKEKIISNLFFLSVIFWNFAPIKAGGRGISIAEFFCLITIGLLINHIQIRLSDLLLFMSILGVIAISFISAFSKSDFIKSFLAISFYIIYTFFILEYSKKSPKIKKMLIDSFVFAIFILGIYGIFQAISIRLLNNTLDIIQYPFGKFTFQIQPYKPLPILFRSNSLYYEPSIFGLFSVIGYFMSEFSEKYNKTFIKTVIFIGIITTGSTTSYLMFFGAFFVSNIKIKVKTISLKTYAISIIIMFFILLTIAINYNKIIINNPVINIFSRLSEMKSQGTSGYYRTKAPIEAAKYVLQNYPIGIGFGNTDYFLSEKIPDELKNYFIMNKTESAVKIANIIENENGYNFSYNFIEGSVTLGSTIDNVIIQWIITLGYAGIYFIILFCIYIFFIIRRFGFGLTVCILFYNIGTGAFSFVAYWLIVSMILINLIPADSEYNLEV